MNEPPGACPVPHASPSMITLGHGGGGRLMQSLIESLFLPAFANEFLAARHDSAVLEPGGRRLAFTTDSYVVRPLFFPGGNIGTLAVNGTVNDLAMAGARPLFLSAGFIIEEGFARSDLSTIVASMRDAALRAGVQIVTGDTKVVDRGKGDGLYINTAGIGILETTLRISPAGVRPGDAIVLSGDIGRHGIAIMAVREGLAFESTIESDCAPLHEPVAALLREGVEIHCLRDLTRGGLASALNEIAQAGHLRFDITEDHIPIDGRVRGACEILGLDPLYVANEGRFVAFVPEAQAERALTVLRSRALCAGAKVIGRVDTTDTPMVVMQTSIGGNRVVDMLSGDQLPRIC
jgi:hydrogenase expression/formation protein HypE